MARPTSTSRRFAEAAFEVASRDRSHEAWARDLGVLAEVVADARVRGVLGNPAIPRRQRTQVLGGLLGDRISRPALNLALLLVDRGRVELLPGIAREFRRLANRQDGILEAEVTTAMPLTTDETEALRKRIETMAGAKIDLQTQIDPSLIGGLTVKVAGRMLDASVRGRLERLRAQLVAGTRAR